MLTILGMTFSVFNAWNINKFIYCCYYTGLLEFICSKKLLLYADLMTTKSVIHISFLLTLGDR